MVLPPPNKGQIRGHYFIPKPLIAPSATATTPNKSANLDLRRARRYTDVIHVLNRLNILSVFKDITAHERITKINC